MSDKKQTAVSWLLEKIGNDAMGDIVPVWVLDAIDEAKELEKQQLIDFYEFGYIDTYGQDEPNPRITDRECGESQYNITFKP